MGLVLWRLRQRRRARAAAAELDEQLVDAVASITAAIRAGRSVPQALSFAASEARPPLRDSLRALDRSIELGVPLDEAVAAWTREVDTDDARLLAGVLTLHRRSGGDLPTVLDEVTATLRERRAAVGRSGRSLPRLVSPAQSSACCHSGSSRSSGSRRARRSKGVPFSDRPRRDPLGLVLEGLAFLWIRHLLEVR